MTAVRNVFFALCFIAATAFAGAVAAGPNPSAPAKAKTAKTQPAPSFKTAQKPAPQKVAKAQTISGRTQKAARSPGINCVQYVRSVSDIELSGDGWMWWGRAEDRYERGSAPQPGAVMVFKRTKSMVHGHVAIVSELVDERTIRINHANWAPRGGLKGRVDTDVMVQDISANNDWSSVRVWYDKADQFGRPYPTYGFVYSPSGGVPDQENLLEARPVKTSPAHPMHPDVRKREDIAALANPPPRPTQVAQHPEWADRRSN